MQEIYNRYKKPNFISITNIPSVTKPLYIDNKILLKKGTHIYTTIHYFFKPNEEKSLNKKYNGIVCSLDSKQIYNKAKNEHLAINAYILLSDVICRKVDYIHYNDKKNYNKLNNMYDALIHNMDVYIKLSNIQRDTSNKLDWTNWFKRPQIDLKKYFPSRYFMQTRKILPSFHKWYNANGLLDKPLKANYILCSFNVHSFSGGNKLFDKNMYIREMFKMFVKYGISIMCLQEVLTNDKKLLENIGKQFGNYHYYYTFSGGKNNKLSMVLISTKNINVSCTKIKVKTGDKIIPRNFFEINHEIGKIICHHAPIGKSYFEKGELVEFNEFSQRYTSNSKKRQKYFDVIISHKPDIIMGDFNCTVNDNEFNIFNKYKNGTENKTITSIYGTKVDFIISINKQLFNETIKLHTSDHYPVISGFN